jgi:hypothetical protein
LIAILPSEKALMEKVDIVYSLKSGIGLVRIFHSGFVNIL